MVKNLSCVSCAAWNVFPINSLLIRWQNACWKCSLNIQNVYLWLLDYNIWTSIDSRRSNFLNIVDLDILQYGWFVLKVELLWQIIYRESNYDISIFYIVLQCYDWKNAFLMANKVHVMSIWWVNHVRSWWILMCPDIDFGPDNTLLYVNFE